MAHSLDELKRVVKRNVLGRRSGAAIAAWVSSLIALGSVALNIWQFVYSNYILPSTFPPHIAIACSLRRLGDVKGMTVWNLTVTAKNDSSARVFLYADGYKVEGTALEPSRGGTDAQFASDVENMAFSELSTKDSVGLARYASPKRTGILACGMFAPTGYWLEPNAEKTISALVYCPKGQYDLLHAYVEALYGRSYNENVLKVAMDGARNNFTAKLLQPSETPYRAAGRINESEEHNIYVGQEKMQDYKAGTSTAEAVVITSGSK